MATKRYWVGMPNVHSKLRPIKYDKLPMKNEYSKFERQFREKNEALAKFNHEFWSEHNQRYDLERIRFLEQRTINVKNIDMNQGGSIVNTPESPVPGDIEAPDNDTLSPTDLGYVALPTHDDSESRFIDNNVAVDSDFVSILDSNLAENGAVTNGSSENVIQRDRIPLSSENVDKIKDLMSRLNIPSPPWAQSVPEDEWKSFLISRLALDR